MYLMPALHWSFSILHNGSLKRFRWFFNSCGFGIFDGVLTTVGLGLASTTATCARTGIANGIPARCRKEVEHTFGG